LPFLEFILYQYDSNSLINEHGTRNILSLKVLIGIILLCKINLMHIHTVT